MELIKDLKGNKGGTNIFSPLESIFKNQIYDKIDTTKHIFVLTDGIIEDKENTLNLIGSYSDKFTLHSLGIGHDYDKDLVKRSAIVGNGNYYFIENLEDININVINALKNSLITKKIKCNYEVNPKPYIEYNQKQIVGIYDFMRYGFILKNNNNISDIEIILKMKKGDINEEQKFNFDINNSIQLPNGDQLGKIIIDYYLNNKKPLNTEEEINLSKDFSILSTNTSFFAEIQNEIPAKEEIITLSNKNKKMINNKEEKKENLEGNDIISENNFIFKDFSSDNLNDINNIPKELRPKKKMFLFFIFKFF